MSSGLQVTASAERVSLMLGLVIVIVCSLPRFWVGGYETRLVLALAFALAVTVAGIFQWRQLPSSARQRLPGLIRRLLACFVGGVAAIGMLFLLSGGWIGWERLVAYGAGTGLIGYAVWLWWVPQRD